MKDVEGELGTVPGAVGVGQAHGREWRVAEGEQREEGMSPEGKASRGRSR